MKAPWVDELRQDLSFAIRQLRAAPGFTSVAVTTLAVGIGVNSAIFALVDATLLRPLPFHEPERLVAVWEQTNQTSQGLASPINMLDWAERSQSFEGIAGFFPGVGGMVMNGIRGTAETVSRQWVSAGLFDVLGVAPIAGRTFHASDNEGRRNLVVLSEGFWRARFNGDPSILGQDVRLDGEPFTVLGVMPAQFRLLGETSLWALRWFPRDPALRSAYGFQAVGRLKPGATLESARADLAAVAEGLAREYPQTNSGRRVSLEPLHDALVSTDLRLTSTLFLGVVGLVLVICCANVAGLLLTRSAARAREFAIRSSVGADRYRMVRQLLTESLVLALIGGAIGLVLGIALLEAAPTFIPERVLPGIVTLAIDWRLFLFGIAAALAAGVLIGLSPARQAGSIDPAQLVTSSESRTATGRGERTRGAVVIGEIAITVLLLVGAGLLLRTLLALNRVERGYHAEGVVTMTVDPLQTQYPTAETLLRFYDAVEREIGAIPGVRSVGWTSSLPLGAIDFGPVSFQIVEMPSNSDTLPVASYQVVSPRYFETVGVSLVGGRSFTDRDTADGSPTCIVSDAFVHRFLGGRPPLGLRLAVRPAQTPQAKPTVREIVGVVRQVRERPDETDASVQVYVPLAQHTVDDVYLVVAPTSPQRQGLATSVQAAVGRVDKAQLVSVRDVMTLEDIAARATSRHRFRAVLVMAFAGLALLLAMVGVLGVLAHTTQQRTRECGIRMALGADAGHILRLVISRGAWMVTGGIALGLTAAVMLRYSVAGFLFGVQPLDPVTFVWVPIVLAVCAVAAMAAPVFRALRIDPAVACRAE